MAPPRRLEVGRIGRAHGLRGEVAVTFITDRPERSTVGAELFAGERRLVVVTARPHQGRWLVRFEGVEDRTAAEALLGTVLSATPLAADESDGALWVHELIGAQVVDRAGVQLGNVASVEANPAHDLLVLDSGALIPVVFVVEHRVDPVAEIVVDIPDGLLDL